jgi:hypothetical protein
MLDANWGLLIENYMKRDAAKEKSVVPLYETLQRLVEQVLGEDSDVLGQKLSITFPAIKITENWGTLDNKDRELLELLMKNVRGTTVQDKLTHVQNFITYEEGRPISDIFSNLIFLEIFSNIIKEYNASTTGFLFEAFLAGLFGGEQSVQISDPVEGNLPITDVTLRGVPYSLKVLSPSKPVHGSFKNLVDHFRTEEKIIYLVVTKLKGDETNVLTFAEFEITLDNFHTYVGYIEPGTEVDDIQIVKALGSEIDFSEKTVDNNGDLITLASRARIPGKGSFTKSKLEPDTEYEVKAIVGKKQRRTVPKGHGGGVDLYGSVEAYDHIAALTDDKKTLQALIDTPGYRDKKQFGISPAYVRRTATLLGKLDLRDETLRGVAEAYAVDLQETLIPIYSALSELTNHVNKYFLEGADSTETSRKEHAVLAAKEAIILKDSTDRIVKSTEKG